MQTINGQNVLASGVLILPENTTQVTFPTGLGTFGLKTPDAKASDPHFDVAGLWAHFHLNPAHSTTGREENIPSGEPYMLEIDWIADPMKFRQSVHYRFIYSVRQVPKS